MIGPVALKKILTDDDNHQPIALGHPCDSGDIKTYYHTSSQVKVSDPPAPLHMWSRVGRSETLTWEDDYHKYLRKNSDV